MIRTCSPVYSDAVRMGLLLSFDTATHVATVALLDGDRVLGERVSRAHRVLVEADELLSLAGYGAGDVEALAVGTGPGSFTGLRVGLAAAHGFCLARETPVAGVSTLEALAAGAQGAIPVIDGGRREVFALDDGEPRSLPAGELLFPPGATLVGDGAVRYRTVLEELGAEIPPDGDDSHVPCARHHAALARAAGTFGPVERLQPVYVREPDAKVPA